jgi:hypothetical protein
MKLRNHPDKSQWPPDWTGSYKGAEKMPIGEAYTLVGVKPHPAKGKNPPYLSLEIKHETGTAQGVLHWKKPEFLLTVAEKLRACVGKTVREAGDIEL